MAPVVVEFGRWHALCSLLLGCRAKSYDDVAWIAWITR